MNFTMMHESTNIKHNCHLQQKHSTVLVHKKLYVRSRIVGSDKEFCKTFKMFLLLRHLTFVIRLWSEICHICLEYDSGVV